MSKLEDTLEDKMISFGTLEDLIRQQKNNELQSIVATAEPSTLIDSCGTTLLHLAAKYNNFDLIKILLDLGYDPNLENQSGTTPILTAAMNSHFEALDVLLDVNIDWKAVLQSIIVENRQVPENVIGHVLKRLQNKTANAEKTADILTEIGCPLDLVLLMKAADVTKAILNRKKSLGMKEFCRLVKFAMKSTDMDNVKVLLENEISNFDEYTSLQAYVSVISRMINDPNPDLNSAKLLVEHMAQWNLYDYLWLLEILIRIFEKGSKEVVTMFLDCGVHEYVKDAYHINIIIHMFENQNFKARELLRDRQFDPNGVNGGGMSGLCLAVRHESVEDAEFLLVKGADPNSMDQYERPPLFYADRAECILLLLKYGADVQIIGEDGSTVFDRFTDASYHYVAHLAMLEAQGVLVKPEIRDRINSKYNHNYLYAKCIREIKWMKKQTISRKVTLFTALTESEMKLSSYIQSQETVIVFLSRCLKCYLHSYYYDILQKSLNDALMVHNLKCKAAQIVAECLELEPEHLVIDVIVSFLTMKDLQMLA